MRQEKGVTEGPGESAPSFPTLHLGDPVDIAEIPHLCRRAECLLECGRPRVIVCDLERAVAPDGATIDALARLHLTARRHGGCIRLINTSPALADLLRFAGLETLFEEEPAP